MSTLNEKEQRISRIQTITNLAHAMQDQIKAIESPDIGMVVDAALMLIVGASKQCPSPEVRLNLLNALNETIQQCVAMNHEVFQSSANDQPSGPH